MQYSDAVPNMDVLFATQLREARRELIIVDNKLPGGYERILGPGRVLLGGSNEQWEFSAWEQGIAYLGDRLHDFDLVHLATSAFKALDSEHLACFDMGMLTQLADRRAAIGRIDYYPRPVVLFGRTSQAWLRSSWMVLPPRELDQLGSLVSIRDGRSFFSGEPESPFRPDAPLSANYQQYILGWLTGVGTFIGSSWHSQFRLSSRTLAYFEGKALALMNEQMLSMRLRDQGCAMVDPTWLTLRRSLLTSGDAFDSIPAWRWQIVLRDIEPRI